MEDLFEEYGIKTSEDKKANTQTSRLNSNGEHSLNMKLGHLLN